MSSVDSEDRMNNTFRRFAWFEQRLIGLLDIMIERGLLRREYDGPRYVYFPAAKPEKASRSALKQLVRTFFDNSPSSAMAALLDMKGPPISEAEYRRLTTLLRRVSKQGEAR